MFHKAMTSLNVHKNFLTILDVKDCGTVFASLADIKVPEADISALTALLGVVPEEGLRVPPLYDDDFRNFPRLN